MEIPVLFINLLDPCLIFTLLIADFISNDRPATSLKILFSSRYMCK